jgi:hypothetical protein
MKEHKTIVPVWLFVGIILLVYGVLILGTGVHEFANPPDTVLANLRAPLWWGGFMAIVGAIYVYIFWPGRKKKNVKGRIIDNQDGPGDAAVK